MPLGSVTSTSLPTGMKATINLLPIIDVFAEADEIYGNEGVCFSMVDASHQPQAELSNLECAAEKSDANSFMGDGFESRWFGDWTRKDHPPSKRSPHSISWNPKDVYGNETMLIQQCMFKFQNFILDEEERTCFENEENIADQEKAKTIIAIIDTGINASHECFHDKHLPAPECKNLHIPFRRKIVALENYTKAKISTKVVALVDYNFSEDLNGHGTACASVAAGVLTDLEWLQDISGIPSSKIQGANPLARIASYKVKGDKGAIQHEVEVLKSSLLDAIKKAISDKVDAILIALKTDDLSKLSSYFYDPVNLGGYLTMKENILLCTSAGNWGEDQFYTLSGGLAPWVLQVGSCNSGGKFMTKIKLEGALEIKGYGSFMDKDGHYCELIHWSEGFERVAGTSKGKDPKGTYLKGKEKMTTEKTRLQKTEMNIRKEVEGKIIFYNRSEIWPINEFLDAKAAGVISSSYGNEYRSYGLRRPVVYVKLEDEHRIASYIKNNRKSAKAKICKTVYEEEDIEVCKLTSLSGKGPNPYDQYVLKPDICAPGEDILCASKYDAQNMYAHYSVMSGTSMASAVTVGMVSYIKTFRKDWGPARIKSAIMTSANPMGKSSYMDVLGTGNGCINPLKAMNPGLVYDISPEEFRRYLLSREADKKFLASYGENVEGEKILGMNLNLPNFSLVLSRNSDYIFNRTLTNVGSPVCSYKAEIRLHETSFTTAAGRTVQVRFPDFINIRVVPDVLEFTNIEQRKHFKLIIRSSELLRSKMLLAHSTLIWHEQKESNGRDQGCTVSSPIVIMNQQLWEKRLEKKKEEDDSALPKKRHGEQVNVGTSTKEKVIKLG